MTIGYLFVRWFTFHFSIYMNYPFYGLFGPCFELYDLLGLRIEYYNILGLRIEHYYSDGVFHFDIGLGVISIVLVDLNNPPYRQFVYNCFITSLEEFVLKELNLSAQRSYLTYHVGYLLDQPVGKGKGSSRCPF